MNKFLDWLDDWLDKKSFTNDYLLLLLLVWIDCVLYPSFCLFRLGLFTCEVLLVIRMYKPHSSKQKEE